MEKTVAQKLQIKPGNAVFVTGGDPQTRALIDPLPEGARLVHDAAEADAAILFTIDRVELETTLAEHLSSLAGVRAPWIGYPKGGRSDINRDIIWGRLADLGWRLNSNIALSAEWSAVRLKTA
jgi:hypothetical protein